MNKFTSILTSALLILAMSIIPLPVKAETVKTTTTRQTISEYETIKALKNVSNSELKKEGLSDDEITSVRNLDFKVEMTRRSKLESQQLKNMGYTDDKITALKSFDGSEAQMIALSSTVTISSSILSTQNGGKDYYVNFSWNWSSQPFNLYTDVIGFRASGSTNGAVAANATMSAGSYSTAEYYVYNDSSVFGGYGSLSMSRPDIPTAAFTIPMEKNIYNVYGNGQVIPCWAKSGYGTTHVNNYTAMERMAARFEYGHASSGVSPSISVNGPAPSVSITFTPYSVVSSLAYTQHLYNSSGTIIG
ncbi:MAG TPA: hypothetical protein VIK72_14515 [Clostridiaceae bacterium]